MTKIDVKGQGITQLSKGFLIGLGEESNQFRFQAIGSLTLDESLDIVNNALFHILNAYNAQTEGKLKEEIFERATLNVSLILDKFYPEAKEHKHQELTNQAVEVLKKENEILRASRNTQGKA